MKALSKQNDPSVAIIFVLAVMAICALLLSAGCQTSDSGQKSSEASVQVKTVLEEIQERGVLKVGAAGDYQPMSYLDPKTGSYVGFDAELAEDYIFKYIEDDVALDLAA